MNALLLAYLGNALLSEASTGSGVRRWFEDLVHEDGAVRDAVRQQLVACGEAAVPSLVMLLDHPSEVVQMWVAQTLLEIGEPAIEFLRKAHETAQSEALRVGTQRVLRRMRCA